MVVHTLPMGPPRVVIPISHQVAVWKWGGGGWGEGGCEGVFSGPSVGDSGRGLRNAGISGDNLWMDH